MIHIWGFALRESGWASLLIVFLIIVFTQGINYIFSPMLPYIFIITGTLMFYVTGWVFNYINRIIKKVYFRNAKNMPIWDSGTETLSDILLSYEILAVSVIETAIILLPILIIYRINCIYSRYFMMIGIFILNIFYLLNCIIRNVEGLYNIRKALNLFMNEWYFILAYSVFISFTAALYVISGMSNPFADALLYTGIMYLVVTEVFHVSEYYRNYNNSIVNKE